MQTIDKEATELSCVLCGKYHTVDAEKIIANMRRVMTRANVVRGFFRIWIAVSILWMILVTIAIAPWTQIQQWRAKPPEIGFSVERRNESSTIEAGIAARIAGEPVVSADGPRDASELNKIAKYKVTSPSGVVFIVRVPVSATESEIKSGMTPVGVKESEIISGVKMYESYEDAVNQGLSNMLAWVTFTFSVPLGLLIFGVTVGWVIKGFRHAD